jgi:riboflavin kinase/FMN adenylyltransferase
MQVLFGLSQIAAEWHQSVVCIGTFDGVHLGHRAVISAAVQSGEAQGIPSVLLTFDRHPAAVLAPDRRPETIAELSTNLREFDRLGVDVTVVEPFTVELSETPAEAFLESALVSTLKAVEIVIGEDFAFGHGREGTPEWLCERIKTRMVPKYVLDGQRVSSSAIRSAVREGRVEDAARLLGRPFELSGIVVKGQQLGRQLGYPTINIARSFEQVTPQNGIYAGSCDTPLGTFRAAVSIGVRPTLGDGPRTIEAFLLDYPGEALYGHGVTLRLLTRLRGEERFASLEELKEQIRKDVEAVVRST